MVVEFELEVPGGTTLEERRFFFLDTSIKLELVSSSSIADSELANEDFHAKEFWEVTLGLRTFTKSSIED